MAGKVYPVQKFLCLTEVVAGSDHFMVSGQYAESGAVEWIDGTGTTIPAGKFIRAGSVIEGTWSTSEISRMVRDGVFAPADAKYNFDLESVFPDTVRFMGTKGENMVPLWQVLNSFGIHTIEEVASNKSGKQPFSEGVNKKGVPMTAREILSMFADPRQVEDWVATCVRLADQAKTNAVKEK